MGRRISNEGEQGEPLLLMSKESGSTQNLPLPLITGESNSTPQLYLRHRKSQWIVSTVAVFLSLVLGYLFGLYHSKETNAAEYGLPLPPGPVQTTWEHNLTFTQQPSPESEAAWASIIPSGRGFVHHAQVAPFISNIAVFHQLHCLHAIVIAYYEALGSEASTNLTSVPEFDNATATRIAPFHIRHCFDYIRQALICAADTNLEVLDEDTRLTNGWGQPKQCRDYEQVFAWAEQYANSSDTGIVT